MQKYFSLKDIKLGFLFFYIKFFHLPNTKLKILKTINAFINEKKDEICFIKKK
jgi:hypothetical protein